MENKPLLTFNELMDLLSCSRNNIYNLINSEVIKPYYFPGQNRKPYFKTDEIIKILEPKDVNK